MRERTSRRIRYGVSTAAIVVVAVLAVAGRVWAGNLLVFITWLMVVTGFWSGLVAQRDPHSEVAENLLESYRLGYHFPRWVDEVFYLVMVLGLAAAGWWVTAFGWLFMAGLDFSHRAMAAPGARAVICVWCEEKLTYEATPEGKAKAWTRMKLHGIDCPKNPWRAVNRELSKELEEADRNVLACLDVLASLSAHWSESGRLWFGEPGSGPDYSDDAEKIVARLLAKRAEVQS